MIYGVVRFVDLRMLLLRPISFSSNCPFAPLTNPPNFFCTLTKFNTPLWFLRGMLTVGFLQFKVWRGIKKKRKRKSHTPSFIACGKHPHQELTRGRHLVGIKHASLIKGTWKGHSGDSISVVSVFISRAFIQHHTSFISNLVLVALNEYWEISIIRAPREHQRLTRGNLTNLNDYIRHV